MARANPRPSVRPTLVLDLPDPQLVTMQYANLGELCIPMEYQREIIRPWVFELADVLAAGGKCPPIAVNVRPDGRRVVVDGQQRMWAHMQASMPMQALVYHLPEPVLDNEKKLYQILNSHVLQSGDNIVNSWVGPVAALVRHWVNLKGSPYFQHTSIGKRGGMAYSAAILARSVVCVVVSAAGARGGIRRVLDRGEAFFHGANGHGDVLHEKAEAVLRLLPLVFPPGDRIRLEPALAVSDVARERWGKGVTGKFPKPQEQQRMRQINWAMLAPGYSARHFPTLRKAVEDRWRTGA